MFFSKDREFVLVSNYKPPVNDEYLDTSAAEILVIKSKFKQNMSKNSECPSKASPHTANLYLQLSS